MYVKCARHTDGITIETLGTNVDFLTTALTGIGWLVIMFKETPECPIARTAELVGDTWTILILRDLMHGSKRFGELQESLGSATPKVSPKTLSQRLKMLEASDILTRHAFAEIPPRVEYALTDKGHALNRLLDDMREFGEAYLS